jgi:anti-sigma factor RsiW
MTTPHYDRDTLIDYLHDELSERDDAAVLLHLDACAACRALHDEEAAFGETLRSVALTEELEFPSMIKAKVWAAVRQEQPSWLDRLRAWGPRIAVPVAAAIALAAYLGTPLRQAGAPVGIEATFFLDEHNAAAQENPFGPGAAPAVYATGTQDRGNSTAASYIDTADAATIDNADVALR